MFIQEVGVGVSGKEGLTEATRDTTGICSVTVLLDNKEVAIRLAGRRLPTSSRRTLHRFHGLVDKLQAPSPEGPGITVDVRWVPGHKGIVGNELADQRASLAATLPYTKDAASVAHVRRLARSHATEAAKERWKAAPHPEYARLVIPWPDHPPRELRLPRPLLGQVIALRTGHGDFVEYHERLGYEGEHRCSCGELKTRTHFYFCGDARRVSSTIHRGRPEGRIRWLVGTRKGVEVLAEWLQATQFFTAIATR